MSAQPRPGALTVALGLSAAATAALMLGALLPVVTGVNAGFSAGPMLIILALLPFAAAVVFTIERRYGQAAGVLLGAAALAPGRIILDMQVLAGSQDIVRPEFYLPGRYDDPPVGVGFWVLQAGFLLTIAAGYTANRVAQDEADALGAIPARRWWQLLAPFPAIWAAVGLVMPPVGSANVFLLSRSAFESPTYVLAGYLLLGAGVVVAASVALTLVPEVGAGVLVGLAAGLLGVAVPSVVSGLVVDKLSLSPGPVLVLIAAFGLVAAALLLALTFRKAGELPSEAKVPGLSLWRRVTGALGVLTAALALAGCLAPVVVAEAGFTAAHSPVRWLLVIAGALTAVLALVPAARPALSVAWAGVVLTGATVLATPVAATRLAGAFTIGPGVVLTSLAMFAAAATAVASVVTGVVEREEAEELDRPALGPALAVPLALAAVLAVLAFAIPVVSAPDYVAPGLFASFDVSSWGLLAGLFAVVGAVAFAVRSRPAKGAVLLSGAAAVVVLRVAELPFLSGKVEGAHAALGFWFALGCLVSLIIAAVVSARSAK
ncbi:hypothetical protein [Amycolatopsis sp. NPDC059657]|uniref:hypothetical protein n=1 Tax=Amycolatopsis sp. NPDC059657 TaxID=3346899 RepID=UPI00366B597E